MGRKWNWGHLISLGFVAHWWCANHSFADLTVLRLNHRCNVMLFCFFKVCLTIRWSYKGGIFIFFFAFVVCAFSLLCSTEHCFLSLLGSRVLRKCLQLQLSPEICVTEGSLAMLRIWMTYVFSLFAFWYIFRGLCCQSFSIWFSAYPNLFWMQSCRKADRIESQVLDFQHIWGTINGMKASISHRMGGRLAEVLLSLSPSIEFSAPKRPFYHWRFLLHVGDYLV